eukprot:345176-Prymnesium_polylepis.1
MSRRVTRRRAASHNVVRSRPTGPLSPSPLDHSAPCRSGQLPRSRTSERVLAAGAIIRCTIRSLSLAEHSTRPGLSEVM